MSTINTLSTTYLQSILQGALQGVSQTKSPTSPLSSSALNQSTQSSLNPTPDKDILSPFGKLVLAFRNLQQTNPAQYQQLTAQISTQLQTASDTAQTNGNTKAAAALQQLSSDFSTASQSGQLPNFPDLAKALVGRHHHDRYETAQSGAQSGSTTPTTNAGQVVANALASAGISL